MYVVGFGPTGLHDVPWIHISRLLDKEYLMKGA